MPSTTSFIPRDLEADHSDTELENAVLLSLELLRKADPSSANQIATEAVVALKRYAATVTKHMEKEERVLVGPWLNLSPSLYGQYRTYLVGKYRHAY